MKLKKSIWALSRGKKISYSLFLDFIGNFIQKHEAKMQKTSLEKIYVQFLSMLYWNENISIYEYMLETMYEYIVLCL